MLIHGSLLEHVSAFWFCTDGREKSNFAFMESADASLSRTLPASLLQPTMQSQPLAQVHIVGSQMLQASAPPPSPTHSQAQEAPQPSRALMSLAGAPSLSSTHSLLHKDQLQPPTGLKSLTGIGESKRWVESSGRCLFP